MTLKSTITRTVIIFSVLRLIISKYNEFGSELHPVAWSKTNGGFFPRCKMTGGRDAWSCILTFSYVFMALRLVNHSENVSFEQWKTIFGDTIDTPLPTQFQTYAFLIIIIIYAKIFLHSAFLLNVLTIKNKRNILAYSIQSNSVITFCVVINECCSNTEV